MHAITDLKDDLFKMGELGVQQPLVTQSWQNQVKDIWQQENACKTAISLPSLYGKGHHPYRQC